MDANGIQIMITTLIASSGLWGLVTYIFQHRDKVRDSEREHEEKKAELDKQASIERIQKLEKDVAALKELQITQNDAICGNTHHDMMLYLQQIIKEYNDGTRKGVSLIEVEDIKKVYEPYRKLGGNGTFEAYYNRVMQMPLV